MYVKPEPELVSRELESLVKELPSKSRPEVERLISGTIKAAQKCDLRDTFFGVGEAINLADKKKISARMRDTIMRLAESVLGQSCGCKVR